jgi:predicted deacylase
LSFNIAGQKIEKGQRKIVEIPMAELFDLTKVPISVEVIRGEEEGPKLFISAAIHGDEIIGSEIVKRLLAKDELNKLKGTLVCVPIVNRFGYNNCTRYLPDRRDLNRCFPGSEKGSLAARIAYTFMNEVVSKCDYGIDIHSGAIHRSNYPQIRVEFNDQTEISLAMAFGAPVIINSPNRNGALRKAANEIGVKTILFEAGEALRFDDHCIDIGLNGIFNVMREIGMIERDEFDLGQSTAMIAQSSHWIRAHNGGSLRVIKKLGAFVKKGDLLGTISDPFAKKAFEVLAHQAGMIIGSVTMPLVNKGDALFHIATSEDTMELDEVQRGGIVLDQDIDIENEDWFIRS